MAAFQRENDTIVCFGLLRNGKEEGELYFIIVYLRADIKEFSLLIFTGRSEYFLILLNMRNYDEKKYNALFVVAC